MISKKAADYIEYRQGTKGPATYINYLVKVFTFNHFPVFTKLRRYVLYALLHIRKHDVEERRLIRWHFSCNEKMI